MPAFVRRTFREFSVESVSTLLGELSLGNAAASFPIPPEQVEAWRYQCEPLQASLRALIDQSTDLATATVLLEYPVPRIGKRIDAVLLIRDFIVVLEFKTGEASGSATQQVEDYALLISNFHELSHHRMVVPVAVYRKAPGVGPRGERTGTIAPLWISTFSELANTLGDICRRQPQRGEAIQADEWNSGRFKPTPTIIEAAVALYSDMDVFEIGHACAAHETLALATAALVRAVEWSCENQRRLICFVTGVPGAGKTLVGLNAAHHPILRPSTSFLSGNGPLVKVLKEALVRDAVQRTKTSRTSAAVTVETFIHNVHRFADEYFGEKKVPAQHVIIFDEAQRAWSRDQNERRYDRACSEPEMLLDIMERHDDWAVIVALVGGGQEINRGEAGLSEWGRALVDHPEWVVWTSQQAVRGDSAVARQRLFEGVSPLGVLEVPDLHLGVSLRAIRSHHWSEWVNHVLDGDSRAALTAAHKLERPPYLTRSMESARRYLQIMRRGTLRSGLVGSASAARLRADGLEPSYDFHRFFEWEHWFLDEPADVRSSSKLEVHATQFEIQGLELDWVCLCWGEDFIWDGSRWAGYRFNNREWKPVTDADKLRYLINAYRVLLTRSRQGTVIYVPTAIRTDTTRNAAALDATAQVLLDCGAVALERAAEVPLESWQDSERAIVSTAAHEPSP